MSKSMLPIEPAQNIHPERRPDDAMERPARISKPDELLQVIEVLGRKVLTQNPQRLFSYAVHTFAGLLATPVCSLWLMDEDSHELLLAASCNWPGSAITKDYRLPWDSFIGRTLATKRLRILDDARSNPEFADPKLAREQDWRSALAVPILCLDGSVMGVIAAYSHGRRVRFSAAKQALAITFARHLAIAIKQILLLSNANHEDVHDCPDQQPRQPLVQPAVTLTAMAAGSEHRVTGLGDSIISAIHASWRDIHTSQSEQLRLIYHILSESLKISQVTKLLYEVAQEINRTFGYLVHIALNENDELTVKASISYDGSFNQPWTRHLGVGIMGVAAQTGKPIIVADVSKDARYVALSAATCAEMALPLNDAKGNVIGVLNLESRDPDAFLEEDQRMFQAIANTIALAIENARRLRELLALREIANLSTRSVHSGMILEDAILPKIMEVYGASACAIYLTDPNSQSLTLYCHVGLAQPLVQRLAKFTTGQGIVGKALAQAKPVVSIQVVSDAQADATILHEDELVSQIAVPVISDSKVVGTLTLLTRAEQRFSSHEIRMLETISASISVIIAKGRMLRRYSRLFDSARDPIVIIGLDKTIEKVNQAACEVLGYGEDELVGMQVPALFAKTSVELARQSNDRLDRLARGEQVRIKQFKIQRKDGSRLTIESRPIAIRDETGKLIEIQSIWRDITRQQALVDIIRHTFREVDQERLLKDFSERVRRILNAYGCSVHLLSADDELIYQAAAAPAGLERESELPGQLNGLVERVVEQRQARMCSFVEPVSASERVGNIRHLLVLPMLSSQGRVLGAVGTIRRNDAHCGFTLDDVDFLDGLSKHLVFALEHIWSTESQQKQQVAQKVVEQIGLVESFLGHRLGNVLGRLPLAARELRRRMHLQDHTVVELLDDLENDCRRAAQTVEQFRNMDKLQQQRYSMRLLDAVREAITQADPPANVKILCDGIPDAEVRGNLYLLNDVILGLIRNAIESMAGGGMVTLAAGASKTYVWLHITDSGCGIDDAVQAKLFNPFFSTKKDYGGGMGLGLWLSRLYLQTLGGDISFCSKPGQGTTFTLKIPLAEHPANTLPAKLDDVEQARTRVLIVDDSPDWRTLLSNMLRYRGFLCRVAENLNEALRAAEETDYDAYLVDIRLVDYDLQNDEGIRFVDRVLNSKPDAPVLLVSGYSRQWRHAGHYFSGYGNVLVKSKTDMEGIEAFIDSLHHIRLSA